MNLETALVVVWMGSCGLAVFTPWSKFFVGLAAVMLLAMYVLFVVLE